jgi:hypothetical protein
MEENKKILELDNNYYNDSEIENIKNGSIPFPFMIFEGNNPKNVSEIMEVISLSGMSNNNGIPDEITVYRHQKGKEVEKLVYNLVK